MAKDFTFGTYEKLLQTGSDSNYEHLTVREYFFNDPPEHFIINRHDVDRKPKNALKMAMLENDYGISSTYYFRTIKETFRPEIIRKIASLGHEIGYHYEDLDRTQGDFGKALKSFKNELERLREITTIDTVCMHGNSLSKWTNIDLWEKASLADYDLIGEAYLSIDFDDVIYFSDTGRTWRNTEIGPIFCDFLPKLSRDKGTPGVNDKIEIDSTKKLMELFRSHKFDGIYILSHPNRWADNKMEWCIELGKDSFRNMAKLGIKIVL